MRHPSMKLQAGRTLLELIIALSLSLLVFLALAAYYGGASRTANVSYQLSALNDEAPMAMLLMGQSVKRAGYGEIVGTGYNILGQTMFDGPHLRGCRSGTFNNPATGDFTCSAGPAGAQDALMVRFQANSVVGPDQVATRNCAGTPAVDTPITTPGHLAFGVLVPTIQNVFGIDTDRLTCSGNGSAPATLAHEVTEFRIYYGYDETAAALALTGGASLSPLGSTLIDADQIWARQPSYAGLAVSAWDFVVSAHVCMVMKTRNTATSVQVGGFAYTGCPQSPTEASQGTGPARNATDGSVHRTYRQVFTVRSRATASPSVSS